MNTSEKINYGFNRYIEDETKAMKQRLDSLRPQLEKLIKELDGKNLRDTMEKFDSVQRQLKLLKAGLAQRNIGDTDLEFSIDCPWELKNHGDFVTGFLSAYYDRPVQCVWRCKTPGGCEDGCDCPYTLIFKNKA